MPSGSVGDDDSRPSKRFKVSSGAILRTLTGVQNVSALTFSTFLGLHLASPIAAALGGSSLAEKTLMITREAYIPLEPLLIWAPLTLHLSASFLKRAYITYLTCSAPPRTIHLVTGWLLLPFVLPHIATHRLIPASLEAPISGMWPSEWGYEFVGYAMASRPWMATLNYMGLVGLALPHAVLGGMKIVSWIRRLRGKVDKGAGGRGGGAGEEAATSTGISRKDGKSLPTAQAIDSKSSSLETPRRTFIPRGRKDIASWALIAVLGLVATGLFRLRSDGKLVGASMATRYEAVLRQVEPVWLRI